MDYNSNLTTILSEATHYYSIGRYEQSIDKLNEVLSHDPNNGKLHFMKAECFYYLNKYEEAKNCCNQAAEYNYSFEECYYLLGRVSMDTGCYVKSEEFLLNALKLNPNRADIIAIYGLLMLITGHDKKASRLIEEGLKIDPQDEIANQVHFYYYLYKNNKQKISSSFQRNIQVSSNEIHMLYQMGVMEMNAKNYKSARESFRQAFLLDPTNNDMLEILQELSKTMSPIFLPQRIIEMLGGPIFVWIWAMATLFLLQYLHLYIAMLVIAILYIVICVYTWISPIIYKKINKYK